jgi:hypothetical protein
MTIKDIIILKSVAPIEILEKPSQKTIEALGKLVTDPQFTIIREAMRKAYNVPPNGYDIKQFIGQKYSNLPLVNDDTAINMLLFMANSMRGEMDFADDFLPQLVLLFFFNAMIDSEYFKGFISRPIKFILGRANIAATMVNYPFEVGAILIPHTISQNTLTEWLKNNWSVIDKQLGDNLPGDPFGQKIHKNMEKAIEIIDLKDNKKYSYAKISTTLVDKYPDDELYADVAWIKKTYFDYKKLLNSTPILPNPKA